MQKSWQYRLLPDVTPQDVTAVLPAGQSDEAEHEAVQGKVFPVPTLREISCGVDDPHMKLLGFAHGSSALGLEGGRGGETAEAVTVPPSVIVVGYEAAGT